MDAETEAGSELDHEELQRLALLHGINAQQTIPGLREDLEEEGVL